MDQGLACGPRDESHDDVHVEDIGELVALLGETPDVLSESLTGVLPAVLEVPQVTRVHVGALEVADEDAPEVGLVVDAIGGEVHDPCPCTLTEEQRHVLDDEKLVVHATSLAREAEALEPHDGFESLEYLTMLGGVRKLA